MTPGHIITPNPKQEPPDTTVSIDDLRQPECECDAVASLQPLLKEGLYRRDCDVP